MVAGFYLSADALSASFSEMRGKDFSIMPPAAVAQHLSPKHTRILPGNVTDLEKLMLFGFNSLKSSDSV